MKDNSKVKNISIPDYKREWFSAFQKKRQEIIDTVTNAETISLVRTMNPSIEALHALIRPDYKPELLTITGSTIKSRYYSKDLITTVLNNLNPDTTRLKIMPQLLNDPNFINHLSKCTNLTTLDVLSDCEITKEQLNNILKKTNLYIINMPHPSKIDITELPTAFKYVGDFEAVYCDGLLIENNRRFDSNYHFFYTDDIAYNIGDIFDFFIHNKLSNDGDNTRLNVISNDGLDAIYYSKRNHSLEYFGCFDDLQHIIDEFEAVNLPIDTVYIPVNNEDYDLSSLYKINKKVVINYDNDETTIEEFEAMRSTINYFKSLITAYPLSPIEQIVFAYDIIKSFEYEDDEQDYRNSRALDKIVKTGKIVCVGYARFLKQVLSELGFKIDVISVNAPHSDGSYDQDDNHERNILRVDDDKYGIHGVFALDPTWDRNRKFYEVRNKNGKNTYPVKNPGDNEILKEYKSIISYIHFLVTKNEYQLLFADESVPSIFRFIPESLVEQLKSKPKLSNRLNNKIGEAMRYLQEFFEEDEYDKIPSYINTERPSLSVMKEILYNVEKAEGYTREATEQTLSDMENYNRSLHEYNGTPVFISESDTPEDNWIIKK